MSKTSSLVPLIILFLLLAVAASIGFIAYQIATSVNDQTRQKMEKRNISFSKDGLKVGVKEKNTEKYADQTQSVLMKVWNASSWPEYKSKLGWGQEKGAGGGSDRSGEKRHYLHSSPSSSRRGTPASTPGVDSEKRRPFAARSASSQQKVSGS
ncbi:MAG: hypothetical protein Q9227_005704 [Pyrenula ochraceoflavens]